MVVEYTEPMRVGFLSRVFFSDFVIRISGFRASFAVICNLQSFAITIYLNSINFPGSPSQIFFPFVKLWQIGYNRPKFPVLIKISFKKLMRLLHRFHHGKWKIVGKMIRLIL